MYKIKFPNDIEISVDQSQTILEAILSKNFMIPHSCRSGRCNSCKCKIIDGAYTTTDTQLGLSKTEVAEGFVLSCLAKPTSDMVVTDVKINKFRLPVERTVPCKVVSVSKYSDTIASLEVRLPPGQPLEFIEGQYVNFLFKGGQKSYSVASFNAIENTLVFDIKKIKSGAFSNYVFDEAKRDDLLRLRGPYGTFFPQSTKNKHLVFLATGTGYGPVRAIIKGLLRSPEESEFSSIYLFRGARFVQDLYLENEEFLKKITYVPTISGPNDLWAGETRYVHAIVPDYINDFDNALVFACGAKAMVEDAKCELLQAGLKEANFFSDTFVASN